MREKICLLCLLLAMSFCVRTSTDVEKIIEGGIEVVINPYNLDPKEPLFSLEEELVGIGSLNEVFAIVFYTRSKNPGGNIGTFFAD